MCPSRCGANSFRAMRQVLLIAILILACSLQGCASSFETLGLGLGLGAAGAVGGAICMISCH
ncbi:hypothetical protein D0B32_24825 [Paraburkholderia sp. DHOC27]|nr:hypothetical protein D0B32_24825 [Paraburkholderia sp. DHOC27]